MAREEFVPRARLADLLGVAQYTVSKWVKDRPDFPSRVRGRNRSFPLVRCIRWYIEWKVEEHVERARAREGEQPDKKQDTPAYRKALADAELAEIKVAQQLRRLVPEEEFAEVFTESCERLRAAIRGMRSRHAGAVLNITTKVEAIRRLGRIEDELLASLREEFAPDVEDDGDVTPPSAPQVA